MPEPIRHHDRLAGKVAIVTGAGAEGDDIGIGRAIALLMGAEGAQLVCADLDPARAQATAERIEANGGRAVAAGGDVGDPDVCGKLVDAAIAAFGRLDILVNNVGISGPATLETMTLDQWNRTLTTNLTSAMLMSQAAIPPMARGGGGSIVNISSLAGIRAMGAIAYGPSKAAMAQLSREIGVLHGREGIRVNTVAPGHVMTPHAARYMSEEMREMRRKVSPSALRATPGTWRRRCCSWRATRQASSTASNWRSMAAWWGSGRSRAMASSRKADGGRRQIS